VIVNARFGPQRGQAFAFGVRIYGVLKPLQFAHKPLRFVLLRSTRQAVTTLHSEPTSVIGLHRRRSILTTRAKERGLLLGKGGLLSNTLRTQSVFVLVDLRIFPRRSALSAPRSINLWLRISHRCASRKPMRISLSTVSTKCCRSWGNRAAENKPE